MTRNIRPVLAGAIVAISLAACSPNPASSFERGVEAFEAHDYRAARIALISGLRDEPGNVEMRALLAQTQIALGDGEGAYATLSELPATALTQPANAVLMGDAEILRGRFTEAAARVRGIETAAADRIRALASLGNGEIEEAQQAFAIGAKRTPADPRLLSAYGRFQLARGDVDAARELASRAVKADTESIEGFLLQGMVAEATGRLPAAASAFEKAIAIHPANFEARLGKARILVAQGNVADANPLLADLQEEDPENQAIAFLRARAAAAGKDWKLVREILQPHENEMRQSGPLRLAYGEALLELGLSAQALSWLQPLHRANPDSRRVRSLLARAQTESGDGAAALETIQPVAIRPDATPDELQIAAAAARKAGSAQAERFSERAKSASPEWIGGELAKADSALRNQQWTLAEQSYENILEQVPARNAMVLNNLAFARMQLGKRDEALEAALEAVKLEPEHPSILDTAGWLLVQTGEKDRGRAMLEKATRLDPDNATIARHLANAR